MTTETGNKCCFFKCLCVSGGTWLAQPVECETLDLKVVSLTPPKLAVEIP